MNRTCLSALLLSLLPLAAFPATASAYLHPRLGRFVSRDPAGYQDGMNSYEYVGSAPTARVDPSGEAEAVPVLAYLDEDWWKRYPVSKTQRDRALTKTLRRGCVGVTCLELGTTGPYPDMTSCFNSLERAKAFAALESTKKKCKTTCRDPKKFLGDESKPRIFAVTWWDPTHRSTPAKERVRKNNKPVTPWYPVNKAGKVKMDSFVKQQHSMYKRRFDEPDYGNFDFIVYDPSKDRWLHATGAIPDSATDDPMMVLTDSTNVVKNLIPKTLTREDSYNRMVFCVACQKWDFGPLKTPVTTKKR